MFTSRVLHVVKQNTLNFVINNVQCLISRQVETLFFLFCFGVGVLHQCIRQKTTTVLLRNIRQMRSWCEDMVQSNNKTAGSAKAKQTSQVYVCIAYMLKRIDTEFIASSEMSEIRHKVTS